MGADIRRVIKIAVALGLVLLAASAAWQLYLLSREAGRLDDMRLSLDSAIDGVEELETKLKLLDEEITRLGFVKVDLYFARMTETDMYIEPVRRVVEKDRIVFNTVALLLEGPGKNDDGLYPIAPKSVKVLGANEAGGMATVNFSKEILQAGYGSEGELAMVSAIVDTLCTLPGIDRVQILVEGKKVESLGGHVFVEDPLSFMEDLLKQ